MAIETIFVPLWLRPGDTGCCHDIHVAATGTSYPSIGGCIDAVAEVICDEVHDRWDGRHGEDSER